jgi:hypothetical protein
MQNEVDFWTTRVLRLNALMRLRGVPEPARPISFALLAYAENDMQQAVKLANELPVEVLKSICFDWLDIEDSIHRGVRKCATSK